MDRISFSSKIYCREILSRKIILKRKKLVYVFTR